MAIKGGEIKYSVSFDVNMQRLNQAFDKIRQLTAHDLMKINPNINTDQATKQINELWKQTSALETAFEKAFNPKLNTVNIQTLNKSLKDSGTNLQKVYNEYKKAGSAGEGAFRAMSSKLLDTNIKLKETSGLFKEIGTTLKNSIKWNIASSIINTFSGKVQEAYGYVKSLDSSLNDIRIVTGKSAEEMDKFAEKANKAAQNLGKSTTDYTKASLIYYQQGLSDEESAARADVTLKAANVTQQNTQEVSEQLTAVWNGYKVSAQEAELYVDKLAAVAAGTASDLEELSTGMSKVASAANSLGVDVDQMNAILSTSISVTRQAPETIGSAYKTIFARMSTIAAGGTDEEDGATLTSYTEKMSKLGVNVLDANNQLRKMGDVVEEVGGKWNTFSKEQQIALAQVMAGTRQYNNLIALFDNWDKYTEALNMSANAAGTLNKQQEIYMESAQARLQSLSTAAEGIFDSLLSGKDIGKIADIFVPILNGVESVIDSVGGGVNILAMLGPALLRSFSPEIAKQILTFKHNIEAITSNKAQLDNYIQTLQTLTSIKVVGGADQELQKYQNVLASMATYMKPEDYQGMIDKIGELSQAYNNQGYILEDLQKIYNNLSNTLDKPIDINNYTKSAEQLQESLGKIGAAIDDIGRQSKNDIDINFKDDKQEIESVLTSFNRLEDKFKSLPNEMSKFSQKQKDIATVFINMNNGVNSLSTSLNGLEKLMGDKAKQSLAGFKAELNNIQSALDGGQWTQDLINKYQILIANIDQMTVELQETASESDQAADKLKKLQEITRELQGIKVSIDAKIDDSQTAYLAEGITQISTSALQATASIMTFSSSLSNIWDNADLTTGQKLAKTLQLVAFNGVSVINSYKALRSGLSKLSGTYTTSTKEAAANAAANLAQAEATSQAAYEARNEAQALDQASDADKRQAEASYQNALANQTQAGVSNARSQRNARTAENRQGTLRGDAANSLSAAGTLAKEKITALGGAVTGTASLGAGLAVLGGIAAALVAIGVAAYSVYLEVTKYDRALESAIETHKQATETLSEVRNQYNEISSSIDDLRSKKDALTELTVGSTEWKEQLQDINKEIESLIEKYPEFKKYATFSNGAWQVSDENIDKVLQGAENKVKQQQMIAYSSEIAVKQAQFNKAQHETQSIAINNKQYSDYEQRGYYTWEQAGKNAVQTDLNKNDTKTISALIKELSVASDDRLLEIASQFQGLQNADGSFNTNVNAIESYLKSLETLSQASNDLSAIQIEDTKAMLDLMHGDKIVEKAEKAGITDEKKQQYIVNATEYEVATSTNDNGVNSFQALKAGLADKYFSGTFLGLGGGTKLKGDQLTPEIEQYIKEYFANLNDVTEDQIEILDEAHGRFKISVKGDKQDEDYKWADYKDIVLNLLATEEMSKNIDEIGEQYIKYIDKAFAVSVATGSTQIEQLTQKEYEIAKEQIENVGGKYQDDLRDKVSEYESNLKNIQNSVTSNTGLQVYNEIMNMSDAYSDLTQEEMQLIANKINDIYNKAGKEGVERFKEEIEGQPVTVALEFDISSLDSDLPAATRKALDDAKIDESVFKNYKENYEAAGEQYSDIQIINYIKAEDDLNKIYDDRKKIFKSLEKAKVGSLDQDQLTYVNQLEQAFEKLTGLDFSTEDIVKNYNIFQGYLEGTEEGINNFKNFIKKLKKDDFSLPDIFKNDDTAEGAAAPKIITDKISQIASELELSQEQIDAIYAEHGYFFNTQTQQYEKNDKLKNLLQFSPQALEETNKYKKGDTASYAELISSFGVSNREELKALGWTRIKVESGQEIWQKNSEFTEYSQYRTVAIDESGNTMEKVADSVGGMPSSAIEQLGWTYRSLPSPGWYKVVDMTTVVNEKVEEGETETPDFSQPTTGSNGKNSLSGSEKKYKKKYETVYDFYDQTIAAKERELKALQDAEKNLTGEALTNNLKKQKELYEDIAKQQKEKLELAKEDIDLQKKKVDDLASEYNLNVQYDDNGYISNIGEILGQLDDDAANAGAEYDAEYKKLKAKQDSNQSLTEDETKHLSDLSDAYDKATDKLNDFKDAYDGYISALDKKNDVIDNIIETQNNIDDTRISSYLAATNKEFERLSTEASNFASAMSDAVAQFQKLSDDEQIDSLKKWSDIASILKDVYSLQKDTLKNDLGNIVSMGDASNSGLAENKEWKSIAEDIKSIQSSDKDLLDMTKYLEILARIENQITLAQKNLDDLRARGASEDDIKNATARLNSYKAIKTEMEEGAKAAQALAKNLDDIYLTAGEVKDQFVDWQISAIDTQIGLIDKKISRLQKQAGKLKGQALIDNLKQQNQQIEKQIKLEKGKLKILQAQMKIKKLLLQQSLSELAASLGTQLSLSFDSLGNITAESIEQMQKVITASLKGAGAMGAAAQQQWNALLQSMESYNAAAAAVQASIDAIEGYGDSMQDNIDSMKDALKEARNLALEIFNAKVDVEINIEDAWRQFDKLKATMEGIKDTNFLAQAELSAKNIQRYLGDISNPNSYFGSGKGSIGILTDHLNEIMSEISVIQSGGESQYYGKDESAAFGDLTNYANQLMSQVEAYYQELENVRQQYSNVIDAIISKNQELIDDYDKMNQLNKHGINISKLLYGEESYDKLSQYYNNISNNTKEMLKTVADSKQYYAEQMARLEAQGDTDSEAYQKMREGYEESMQQVYEYGEQLLEQYSEELMNKVNSYNQKMTDILANLAGFADELLMDQDWEYQTKLMDDYLDATNAAYEMQALQSKFQTSIDDTDNLSSKRELTKVMNEQLDILEKQLEDGQLLTKYDIDRANKVYELTLKQIALEEAQQNKSKMRLRRDSQGNYRYEYVADQEKIEDAKQDLLKTQNDLYNLDKQRTTEMINEVKNLRVEYLQNEQAILEDAYLTKEEKEQALVDLQNKYYAEPDGLIYMAVQEYNQAKKNMEADTDEEIIFYHNTMAEAMSQNWNDVAQAEADNTKQILEDLKQQEEKVKEATELMSQGYDSLDEAINRDILSMNELLMLDEELLNQYEQEMVQIEALMEELEALEDHYKAVMDAALAAVEAALQLRQMNWEEDDGKSSTSNSSSSGGSGSTTSGSGSGGSTLITRTAEIKVNNQNEGCISDNNGNLTNKEKSTIKQRAKDRGYTISTKMLSDKEAEKKYGKVHSSYIPFDTGGYTGQWGQEGKVAMLHEKELVLNKTDTQNILDAVSIVRNLTAGLTSLQDSLVNKINTPVNNTVSQVEKESTTLDQNVHIEAVFPNVSNSNEIEKAFNDLVNLASQRAMSTRK